MHSVLLGSERHSLRYRLVRALTNAHARNKYHLKNQLCYRPQIRSTFEAKPGTPDQHLVLSLGCHHRKIDYTLEDRFKRVTRGALQL